MIRSGPRGRRARLLLSAIVASGLALAVASAAVRARRDSQRPSYDAMTPPPPTPGVPRTVTEAERLDALRRAQVWRAAAPAAPRGRRKQAVTANAPLECRFVLNVPGGTIPKFDCVRPDGTKLRVKYGNGAERHAEVAASRLLSGLGFGTDRVEMVERVRCHGCPSNPFVTMKAVGLVKADALYARVVDYGKYVDFDWVSIEERFPGDSIQTEDTEGWAWFELDRVVEKPGGAPRAHLDALRLLAVFLAHWDNKSENQRLVCLPGRLAPDGRCTSPFAFIQDLGATFGPLKVDLDGWRQAPIWADRATCRVSMEKFPWQGGTFRPAEISESGRRFLADLLLRLSDREIEGLFSDARFQDYDPLLSSPTPVAEWVTVFESRVRQIAAGPPCPTT